MRQGRVVSLFAAAAFAASASPAGAEIIPVTGTADTGAGSLRQAMIDANSGGDDTDTIEISATGTITLASALPQVSDTVTINGPGRAALTVQRPFGDPADFRIFTIGASEQATIRGLTMRGGHVEGPNVAGGAIFNAGSLTLENVAVADNSVQGTPMPSTAQGGAIYSNGALLAIRDSSITGNFATGTTTRGAAISTELSTDSVVLERVTVSQNLGAEALHLGSDGVSVTNATVTGNPAGGLEVRGPGTAVTADVASSTIHANGSPNVLSNNSNVVVRLQNTIVSDPGGGPNCDTTGAATITSLGHNLADDTSCGLVAAGDQIGVEAGLPALADNGGPTPTLAIPATSLAHDAGRANGVSTDQRGIARPYDDPGVANAAGGDGSDIGAFEIAPPAPPPADPPAADTTPPETTIDKGPKGRTEKRKVKIRFSSSEPGSTFECKVDAKAFKPCASPTRVKAKKKGKHDFKVRATDAAGNRDASPAKARWKYKPKRP